MRTTILYFIIFFCVISCSSQTLILRSALFQNPENISVQLSPDGKMVGWIRSKNGIKTIQYMEFENNNKLSTVTFPETDILGWQWSHQNTMLVYTKSDINYSLQHIFTSGKRFTIFSSPSEQFRIIAHTPLQKDKLMLLLHSADTTRAGVYTVNLNEIEFKRVLPKQEYTNFYFDGNYNLKAAIKPNKDEGHDLYVLNSKGEPKLLRSYPFDVSEAIGLPLNTVCGIKYDGSEMYFTDNLETDMATLKLYRFSDGTDEVKTFFDHGIYSDYISSSASFNPKTNQITSIPYIHDIGKRDIIDKSLQPHFDYLNDLHKGDVALINQSMDGKKWLIRFNYGGPNEYFIYSTSDKKLTKIISEIPALDKYKFSHRTGIVVPTKGSLNLPCQLYLPIGSDKDSNGIPDKPLPTILYIHGGPWLGFYQNNWLINRHLQLLANRGYAVINVAFRGTIGFGKKFFEKSFGEWGGEMHNDILAVADYAVKNKISIKEKIGIFGWSYGGYAVAYAMGKSPDTFACGIDLYGVNDLETFMTLRPNWYDWVANPTTPEGKEKIKNHSPMSWVSNIKNPILISHGAKDKVVPQSQSDVFAEELKKQNKTVIYTVYPDEAHDFRKPETWKSFWSYAEDFLQKNLGGTSQDFQETNKANIEWKMK